MSRTLQGRSKSGTDDGQENPWPALLREQRQSRVDGGILLLVVVTFGVTAGLPGIATGLVLAGSWFVFPNVAVFAAGVIALVAVIPSDAAILTKGLAFAALSGLLLTTTISDDRLRDRGAILGAWAVLGLALLASWILSEALWISAAVLSGAAIAGFTGITVFELKQLGALEDE